MKLTVLATIQKASAELGLSQPTTVVSSTDATVIQLNALLGALCDELIREYNWSSLQTEYTFAVSSGVDTYPMPADYLRVVNATEWNRSARRPLVGPVGPSTWQRLKGSTTGTVQYAFRIKGSNVVVFPVPSSAATMALEYVSGYYVIDGFTGLPKSTVDNNTDLLAFDDRLIINGLKLKFKEAAGLNSESAAYDYETTKATLIGADAGAPVLMMGRGNSTGFMVPNVSDGNWGV
jgi:hypothetical protein